MENVSPARADRGLNPTTRLALAACLMVVCVALPRWAPPVVVALVFVAGRWTGRLKGLAIVVLALAPLLASTVVINLVWPDGGDRLGGLRAALVVLGLSLPPSLLFLTTPLEDLLADLEAKGLPAQAAFVLAAAVAAVPRTRERAMQVADARRARGLDRDDSWPGRVRGLVELTGPVVYATLAEVEDRTLALESRGFGTAPRRTVLHPHPDTRAQLRLRWLLVALAAASVVAALALH